MKPQFCTSCGHQLDASRPYCTECGAREGPSQASSLASGATPSTQQTDAGRELHFGFLSGRNVTVVVVAAAVLAGLVWWQRPGPEQSTPATANAPTGDAAYSYAVLIARDLSSEAGCQMIAQAVLNVGAGPQPANIRIYQIDRMIDRMPDRCVPERLR